jgi:phosphatidylglycerophosphatase A
LLACAVLVTGRAARAFGRPDPQEIVLDEFVSIPATLFLVPLAVHWYAVGFGLNRLLDIVKPPPIRQLQRLPGGWGIVADDVAAAVVANVALQVFLRLLA